ncbi:MAG: CPBP family glutamic-type intramembrane protease, partial [Pseudomonadota bacterium]
MTAPVPAEHGSGRPWRQWLQPPAALVLALLWIVALGAGAHLPTGLAFAVLALVAATFWACHIYQERPRGWHYGRLVRPAAHWLPWALGMVLALTAWRVLAAAELSRVGVLAPAALQAKVTAWTAVAAVLVAPLVEEFGFRLWLQSALERVLPFALALLLASIAFALIHEPTLALLHAA